MYVNSHKHMHDSVFDASMSVCVLVSEWVYFQIPMFLKNPNLNPPPIPVYASVFSPNTNCLYLFALNVVLHYNYII